MLQSAPHRADQDARALRERFELAATRDDDKDLAEAARALFWFCSEHPEYRLFELRPDTAPAVPEKAQRIVSKYDGRCRTCDGEVKVNDIAFWTPETKGVECSKCGGGKK